MRLSRRLVFDFDFILLEHEFDAVGGGIDDDDDGARLAVHLALSTHSGGGDAI